MVPFSEVLDVERLHVQAPTEIIFLCGGETDGVGTGNPKSLRDAFRKVINFPSLSGRDVVLAEDFTKLYVFSAHYKNILEFETDLAQLTELVILFCESEGSFTELGAFSMIPEIANRLLVVIRDSDYIHDSFIKLGPLMFLNEKHNNSVFVIEDKAIGIFDSKALTIDISLFKK